jgi:hypothetical protein
VLAEPPVGREPVAADELGERLQPGECRERRAVRLRRGYR